MTEDNHPVTFEEFQHMVAEALQLDEKLVVPEASFMKDLYADSIRLVELLLHLEEEGIKIPFEEAWNIQTVGDAYRLYSAHAADRDSAGAEPGYNSEA